MHWGWLIVAVVIVSMIYSAGRKRGQRDNVADITARAVGDLLNRSRGGGL